MQKVQKSANGCQKIQSGAKKCKRVQRDTKWCKRVQSDLNIFISATVEVGAKWVQKGAKGCKLL